MSFAPTVPPTTTTTTTTTTTATTGSLLPDAAAVNDHSATQRSDGLSEPVLWADSSSFAPNPLDLWFEQAVSGAPASSQGLSPRAAAAANAIALPDVFGASDPLMSFDLKNEPEFTPSSNTVPGVPASLNLPPVYPSSNDAGPSSSLPLGTHADPIASHSGFASTNDAESPAPALSTATITNSGAASSFLPTTSTSFDTSVSPAAPASSVTPGASSSGAKPARAAQSSFETRLESPILSHTDLHPFSASDAASVPTATSPDLEEMAPLSLLDPQSVANDGLSAVERAKRSAEQFTMQQLAKRRRKGTSPPAGNSGSEDDGADDATGGQQSHRKYQKRLQKNRDSAFVSRIRRREYTRILEQSLSAVEKEKETALAAFREMKRRFDIVSAELTGIKTAAASNFVNLGDAVVNRVAMPQTPVFQFGSTQPPPRQQAPRSAYGKQTQSQNTYMGPQHPRTVRSAAHTGTVMTTMYMIAFVVGVLLPDLTRRPTGDEKFLSRDSHRGSSNELRATDKRTSNFNLPGTPGHGHVWGAHSKSGHLSSEDLVLSADISNGAGDRLVDTVRDDAVSRLGQEIAERALDTARRYLQMLTPNQIANIERAIRGDQTYEGFEALLRAIILDDGGDAGKGLDLDEIVSQVAGLSFEDRV